MSAARRPSVRARLAAAGLDPERAVSSLQRAGLLDGYDLDEELLAAVSTAADPQDALDTVAALAVEQPDRFERVRADPDWLARVVAVGGVSSPLGDLIARHPEAVDSLETLQPIDLQGTVGEVADAVRSSDDRAEQAAAVAAIRRRSTAEIAARDLTGLADLEEVAAELTRLAEAVLRGTLEAVTELVAGEDPGVRLAVIGMGKLGGKELNYVSDVDVVFVHAPQGGADEETPARQAREILTRVLELLNSSTTMGRAYEIDPSLRPEGRSGPLSRTIGSYVAYWERWAKTWEFQALLKARAVAGDPDLGEEFLRRAEPYVWPERLEAGIVAEVREMKSRIEAKPEVLRHGQRQIKLGPGGIRDIEFAVQLLQLVHGRADHSLRSTGTLETLEALVRNGYVDESDARAFGDAYRLLRTVEHRLQLDRERRTHTIPADEERQEWLARSLGYRAEADRPARAAFLADLRQVQAGVRELHAKLFYRPLLETYATVSTEVAGVSVPGEVTAMGDAAAVDRLVALGFRDGERALRAVRAMTSGVSRRARTLRAVLPAVLQVLQDTPDPDVGLASFRDLMESQGDTGELITYLRDNPSASELLGRVLGTSRVAGELLAEQPQGVEWLRDERLRDEPRTREQLVRMAVARLHWQDTTAALRRFKRLELLRIVLRDLSGGTVVGIVGEELTALGESCLVGALRDELRSQARVRGLRSDDELPVVVSIIGMGKLGGRELNYVSDLDVMFVHEPVPGADPADANALALAIAGNVMRSLSEITAEGTAFDVDADLRPEGRGGPLSRTLTSYASYWERWAQPWEHQALLKARFVAGDAELGRRFRESAADRAFPADFGESDLAAMRRMKARIEKERLPKRADPARHLKLGPGGLADVEWTVQLLQHRHGARFRSLRTTGTMAVIDSLEDAQLVPHQDAVWLRDGYRFLVELRNRLYLLRQRDVDVMPGSPAKLETLARSLGYERGDWQRLEDDRQRHARHVRRVCERIFYGI